VIGQLQVAPDSNEIAAALTLLETLPLSAGTHEMRGKYG
jgi:hypothetical protein